LKPRPPFLRRETVERHLSRLDTSSAAAEKDLNIAYDDIFRRNTAEGTLEHDHASRIYKMLLCCMKPFSIAAVTAAVAFNEDNSPGYESIDHAYVRQLTQDFIVETERGTLEFAHVSVKDYLQGEHQSDYNDVKCHAQVALTCLKYISSYDMAFYEVTIQSNVFLQYSLRFWGEHCEQLSKEDRQSLGVSKELFGWIFGGSGLMTFQNWLHIHEQSRGFSKFLRWNFGNSVFLACHWNLVEVLEKSLSENPLYDLNLSTDDEGCTPLTLASKRGHKAVAKLLLEKGADMNTADRNGWMPLHWASKHGHIECIKLLLEKLANINAAIRGERTPLYIALDNRRVEVVKLLLEKGADINVVNKDGWTLLFMAAMNGYVEVVKLLLEKRVDINVVNTWGWTPLSMAAKNGHVEVVKLLLEKGADIHVVDGYRETPLSMAAKNGHVEIVKLLLEQGADVDTVNRDGERPPEWGYEYNFVEAFELLYASG
jgi:ankyrin repeat protein